MGLTHGGENWELKLSGLDICSVVKMLHISVGHVQHHVLYNNKILKATLVMAVALTHFSLSFIVSWLQEVLITWTNPQGRPHMSGEQWKKISVVEGSM